MTPRRNDHTNDAVQSQTIPEGYLLLFSTETMFDLDLVRTNLAMNGIDVQWSYPELWQLPADRPSLFVRPEQQEQALAVIASLDLSDFIIHHG